MKILEQLRGMVAELRSIRLPAGCHVANVDGEAFFDPRLPSRDYWGPFATKRAFHDAIIGGGNLDGTDLSTLPADIAELLFYYWQYGRDDEDLVFTHGDLSSLNVLVHGDTVVGIIDWETSGWFPSYWEYVGAKDVNSYNELWSDEVDHFITPMPQELEMDRIRFEHFAS